MSEIIDVQKSIREYEKTVEKYCRQLKDKAKEKAVALAVYKMVIAKTEAMLANGKSISIDGEPVTNPAATNYKVLATGYCWKELQRSDLADSDYKSTIVKIDAAKALLNAEQSVYRHLENEIR